MDQRTDVHQMALTNTDESGVQEWHCEICGRMLWVLPQSDGSVEIIDINSGNDSIHEMGADPRDERRMQPFLRWIDSRRV